MEPLYWNPPETAPTDFNFLGLFCTCGINALDFVIRSGDDQCHYWLGGHGGTYEISELIGWIPNPLPHNQKPKQETGSAADATHYQRWPLQPIEVMQRAMSPEAFRGFLLGNVIKYQMRAGQKGGQQGAEKDRKKALQYDLWLKMVMKDSARLIDPRKDVV